MILFRAAALGLCAKDRRLDFNFISCSKHLNPPASFLWCSKAMVCLSFLVICLPLMGGVADWRLLWAKFLWGFSSPKRIMQGRCPWPICIAAKDNCGASPLAIITKDWEIDTGWNLSYSGNIVIGLFLGLAWPRMSQEKWSDLSTAHFPKFWLQRVALLLVEKSGQTYVAWVATWYLY